MTIFKNKSLYIGVSLFILGIVIGILGTYHIQSKDLSQSGESRAGGYKLINPLYECETNESYGVREFKDLEDTLATYSNEITAQNSIDKVAIYFRDLNNGPWFGVNEREEFAPSSLLKLPILMAFLKKSETDPSLLNKKILFSTDVPGLIQQNFVSKNHLEKGKEYSIENLLERMIQGSDNASLGLLLENSNITGVSEKDIDRVTLDLGIPTADEETPNDFLDVKEYSALFRVLFNASYLNNESSEKALSIMSKVEFTQGMAKPIPKNIIVSHKFGERHLPSGINQLHDCGIIYYPNHPYLLCIMTRGSNFPNLEKTLQQISEKIYTEVSQRYSK